MIKHIIRKLFRCKGNGISILVPFHCEDQNSQRAKNWRWLRRYWKAQLPGAEIIIGIDRGKREDQPFSKAAAVNDAAKRAHGDIYVIVDADGYMEASAVLHCANEIRKAEQKGLRLWFIPYRHFYRLNEPASQLLLNSSPQKPYLFSTPPRSEYVQNTSGSQLGHWYGALIQILPRTAFRRVGGWDPRFRGWGGEDHAAMRAADTLYWPHKTLPTQVLHVWHPMISQTGFSEWVDWRERMWEGQAASGANDALSGRYYGANGDRKRMRQLVDEGLGESGD